jgi:uncharacterized protein YggE
VLAAQPGLDVHGVTWHVDWDNPAWPQVRAAAIGAAIRKARDYAAALGATLRQVEHHQAKRHWVGTSYVARWPGQAASPG